MSDEPVIPVVDRGKPENGAPTGAQRSKDDIALDLMKFIAVTTGYGKSGGTAGFSGKPTSRTPEEYAEALLGLFERCRRVVNQ
jgi:hypothetical protein